MAGSYQHAVAADGQLLRPEFFGIPAETQGDAYETCEEMYGMIWWLATRLGGDAAELVDQARREYQRGLRESPGTDGVAR